MLKGTELGAFGSSLGDVLGAVPCHGLLVQTLAWARGTRVNRGIKILLVYKSTIQWV